MAAWMSWREVGFEGTRFDCVKALVLLSLSAPFLLNIFCKLKFFPLPVTSNWTCSMSLSYPVDFVGIGVPLVLMTTGRVALYDPVGLLISPKRKTLADQILREGAPTTLL
jgi:hypothetical protein